MKDIINNLVISALKTEGLTEPTDFVIEHPADLSNGDYSSNIALVCAKKMGRNPVSLATTLVQSIQKSLPKDIIKVEAVKPGFINFYLAPEFFAEKLKEINEKNNNFGKNNNQDNSYAGKKVAIEYTDPNPFKQFHIGHLMTNVIGEAVAHLYEWNDAKVKRYCYQGDVGRHVALTLWGFQFMGKQFPADDATLGYKTAFLGEAYALAAKKIKEKPELESEIQIINKKIYDKSDAEINKVYQKGKSWSLEHFEKIYKILGTKFDHYFFESESAPIGIDLVNKNTPKIFKESEGAIIFPGEDYGLHTRVLITKENLPTYEAKDLGLAKIKYDFFPFDIGIVITGNEQNDYFKVVLKILSLIAPEIAEKSSHLSHGMLRFATGKMASREGNVITGESLINEMIEASSEKMKDRNLDPEEKRKIAEKVAVGALKYSILKQSIGKDIIFDKEKSLSFEGDSGPYLQYAHTRAMSVLRKAKEEGIDFEYKPIENKLSKMLYRLPEIIESALILHAPHQLITYLTELAAEFNRFYAGTVIVSEDKGESSSRVALVSAFAIVMRNGLDALGIPVPEKM